MEWKLRRTAFAVSFRIGSGGRIRTYDQRINSPLRYRCATPDQVSQAAVPSRTLELPPAISPVEARAGIEPTCKDLQSSA